MNTNTRMITQDDRFIFFMLSTIDSIGCETIKRIDNKLDNMADILRLTDAELKNDVGLRDAQLAGFGVAKKRMSDITKEYELLMKSSIRFCTYKDPDYPARLRKIRQSPAVLYSYGPLLPDEVPSVGIVGSRACTGYGAKVAEYFAEELSANGVSIISGMAVGIDAAAHRGALKYSGGRTYAVLAGGVNVIYPRENKYIYDEIVYDRKGAVISEFTPGKAAVSHNFPMRNRIISGLSDIILIVEAREKSGSLITAEYARTQNIPVMVIPGRITDPMSQGTNRLISSGHKLANSPGDIMDQLMSMKCAPSAHNNSIISGKNQGMTRVPVRNKNNTDNKEKLKLLDNNEKIVYSTVVSDPKHIEIIMHESALPREDTLEALISLELKGYISQVSSNYFVSC